MIKMLREADESAILTLVGTSLIKFAAGILGIWGATNIYFFSYLRNNGTTITSFTNSIILLCAIVPSAFMMLIATRLSKVFGYKVVIRGCGLVFATLPFVINIKLNLFVLGLCYLVVPISCLAISSIPVLNCLWSHFPGHLNKVSGAAVLFFALGTIVFNFLFVAFTNPNNQPATLDQNGQAFFSAEVANNIFRASNINFLIAGICYMAGSFMVTKKDDNQNNDDNNRQNELAEQSPPCSENDENGVKSQGGKVLNGSNEQIDKQKIKLSEALFDKKFIVLFWISFLVPLYLIYLTLYMKLIFMPLINDDHYLASCAMIVTFASIVAAPLWGCIGDSKGFKFTLLLVVVSDLLCKILGLFCTDKWNIIILYFLLSFNDKGILTIIGPGLIQMFGLEMATQLIPYKGISQFLAYITVPIIQIIFSQVFSYQSILLVLLSLSFGSLFLGIYFYEKINYVKHSSNSKTENKAYEIQQKKVEGYFP